MGIKKNKIHNPQIITDTPPNSISASDIGRLWVDKVNNNLSIAIGNRNDGTPELRNILDTEDLENIDKKYYRGISEEFKIIEPQVSGDIHYDTGYDFFNDKTFKANTNQTYDDYYSYFYKEVENTNSNGYIRSISTASGTKHIRAAIGTDTYEYEGNTYNLVNYSKIILNNEAKEIISITFDNKDILESGFVLSDDKKTIFIYNDPEGFFIGKSVKIKYLI